MEKSEQRILSAASLRKSFITNRASDGARTYFCAPWSPSRSSTDILSAACQNLIRPGTKTERKIRPLLRHVYGQLSCQKVQHGVKWTRTAGSWPSRCIYDARAMWSIAIKSWGDFKKGGGINHSYCFLMQYRGRWKDQDTVKGHIGHFLYRDFYTGYCHRKAFHVWKKREEENKKPAQKINSISVCHLGPYLGCAASQSDWQQLYQHVFYHFLTHPDLGNLQTSLWNLNATPTILQNDTEKDTLVIKYSLECKPIWSTNYKHISR